jgi:ABC-type multidrug transport system fused ATPase/permease subunit
VTNVLADTIPGIRVVKAFAQEGREAERFLRRQPSQPRDQRPRQQGVVAVRADA